jgi:cellulose synthase/poly-beta-1,6-N-acetylglucosamine synthase-like glycosyltransferase
MVTLVLIVLYAVVQTGYLGSELLDLFFLTRPTNWVDPTAADSIADDELPRVVLVYPVLDEAEETMRTTFFGLQNLDYPTDRYRVVAVVNGYDSATVLRLDRLRHEYPWLELMVVPPTNDPSWEVVWEAWEREPNAYWWHAGEHAGVKDLPPKKTRQLIYAFYHLLAADGDDWILDYIDADSVPPAGHLREAAAGLRTYDVMQSTNIAGNLLDTWAASWHAMDHMAWDGFMYSHLSDDGHQPFWVLGKGLFYMAPDLVALAGFNPWVAIEDPEVGMRLWKHGRRLGVIADPLIEEVPVTFRRGVTQRKRWICGFFQALSAPLTAMGFTRRERFRARLNLLPCLSLALNPVGVPLGVWAIVTLILGISPLPLALCGLSLLTIALYALIMSLIYVNTWRRTAIVLERRRDRLHYMLRVSPPCLFVYWTWWIVPIVIGFGMFLREGGLVWERTTKTDANHELVREIR